MTVRIRVSHQPNTLRARIAADATSPQTRGRHAALRGAVRLGRTKLGPCSEGFHKILDDGQPRLTPILDTAAASLLLTSRLLAAALLDRGEHSGRSPVAYPDLVTNPGHLRKALHPSRAVVPVVMRAQGTGLEDGRKASRGRWGRRAACQQVALKGLGGGAVVVGPP